MRLPDALRNLPLLRVEVLKKHACDPGAGGAAFSVERIRRDGMSRPNRCGTIAIENAPAVLTVFVKGKKDGAEETLSKAQVVSIHP